MKQLFWKEWRELRFLPPGAGLVFFILVLGYFILCSHRFTGTDFQLDTSVQILWFTWWLFAVLAGSGLFSQEIGSGTLSFLLSMPGSRRKIWTVKTVTGLGVLMLSILCSSPLFLAFDIAVFSATGNRLSWSPHDAVSALFSADTGDALLVAAGCFSVSIAISPLVDRYISAATVSLVACVAFAIGLSIVSSVVAADAYRGFYYEMSLKLTYLIVWLSIPAFVLISYVTFARGESLRTGRRFYLAGGVAVASFVVILLLFPLCRSWALTMEARTMKTPTGAPPTGAPVQAHTQASSLITVRQESSGTNGDFLSVTLPAHHGNLTLKYEIVVDGRTWGTGEGNVDAHQTDTAADSDNLFLYARTDNGDQDRTIKTILRGQGIRIPYPNNVTFVVSLSVAQRVNAPITLRFAHGWGYSSDVLAPSSTQTYKLGDRIKIMDKFFCDSSIHAIPAVWKTFANDGAFESHFAPGIVHRITVRVIFLPAT